MILLTFKIYFSLIIASKTAYNEAEGNVKLIC